MENKVRLNLFVFAIIGILFVFLVGASLSESVTGMVTSSKGDIVATSNPGGGDYKAKIYACINPSCSGGLIYKGGGSTPFTKQNLPPGKYKVNYYQSRVFKKAVNVDVVANRVANVFYDYNTDQSSVSTSEGSTTGAGSGNGTSTPAWSKSIFINSTPSGQIYIADIYMLSGFIYIGRGIMPFTKNVTSTGDYVIYFYKNGMFSGLERITVNDSDLVVNFQYPPACDDRIRNGDEQGVDCGGSCANLCSPPPACSPNCVLGQSCNSDTDCRLTFSSGRLLCFNNRCENNYIYMCYDGYYATTLTGTWRNNEGDRSLYTFRGIDTPACGGMYLTGNGFLVPLNLSGSRFLGAYALNYSCREPGPTLTYPLLLNKTRC